jgi:hypothetical protein
MLNILRIRFVGRKFFVGQLASCVAPAEIGRNHVQTKRIIRDATFKERRMLTRIIRAVSLHITNIYTAAEVNE